MDQERVLDVLPGGEDGNQIERLEDVTDPPAAEVGELAGVELRHIEFGGGRQRDRARHHADKNCVAFSGFGRTGHQCLEKNDGLGALAHHCEERGKA